MQVESVLNTAAKAATYAAAAAAAPRRQAAIDPLLRRQRGALLPRLTAGLVLLALLALLASVIAYWMIEKVGVSPRQLSPYVAKRSDKHHPAIMAVGSWAADRLMASDRGQRDAVPAGAFRLGAQPQGAERAASSTEVVNVDTSAAATAAIANAKPGQAITFAPGRYRFEGKYIGAGHAGTVRNPITVRAEQPGTVELEFAMSEGFLVNAPYWVFENLTIRGICEGHRDCEHAFHVVGNASHFTARNNTITDFNAHFKINGQDGAMPDDGLIEFNTLTNSSIRQTSNPVTPIDLVAASNWVMRKNLITDFSKSEGGRVSYGAFAKGAGKNNLFENNIVICEYKLHAPGSQQVGLSLGGGGTGKEVCRDKRCVTEQDASIIRGNLIASCSDEGIYINRSATSKIIHNTLIDTGGISVRFVESSADLEGNLIDGPIRLRDNAILRDTDNLSTSVSRLYLGSHPVRQLFDNGARHTLSGKLPRRAAGPEATGIPDLCGTKASGPHSYGAFDNFADCLRPGGASAG